MPAPFTAKKEPAFTAKEVCAALDVPRGTLNWWAHGGYMSGLGASRVTAGKKRQFPLKAVVALAIMKQLVALGIALENASDWAKFAVLYFDGNPTMSEFHIYLTASGAVAFPEIRDESAPGDAKLRITIYPKATIRELKRALDAATPASKARRK